MPCPYRDELLSSWLGRVACRYGLDAEGLVTALVGGGGERGLPIDDAAPSREFIAALARAGGVDPARLSRLTLAERHPGRPEGWFSRRAPPWAPTALRTPPVCYACLGADRAVGRDDHLRAFWRSAASVPSIASCCGIIVARCAAFARPESVSATPWRPSQEGREQALGGITPLWRSKQILAHPHWIAAGALPEKRRGRVLRI